MLKAVSYNDRLVALENEIQQLRGSLARQAEMIASLGSNGSIPPKLSEIIEVVCDYYGLTETQITGPTKFFARPRMVVYFLARKLTNLSMPQIGRHLGDRDHSTVQKGAQRIAKLLKVDEVLRDDIDLLELKITEKVLNRESPCGRHVVHKLPVLA